MVSMSGLLNTGRQALSVQKMALGVTGNNMANAATPGYSRQRINLQTTEPLRLQGGLSLGNGVKAAGVTRAFDQFTWQRLLTENSRSGYYDVQQGELKQVEAAYNESSSEGLSSALNALFTSFNTLAQTPEGVVERDGVLNSAEALTHRFHQLSDTLEQTRVALTGRIEASVASINDLAEQIAKLNGHVAAAEPGNGAGNLKDQRDELIRQMSEQTDVTVTQNESGTVTLSVGGHVLVQDATANELVLSEVNGALQLSTRTEVTEHNITDQLSSGALAGAIDLRDGLLAGYQDELDKLAFTLVQQTNAQHSAGYGLDGVNGRNLFTPLAVQAGAASSISVSSDVAGKPEAVAASSTVAGLPGDNANAVALYQLGSTKTVDGIRTFSESFLSQASQVGRDTSMSTIESEREAETLTELEAMRESASGVSLDEEATDLLKYQAAYQAAARFITTVKEVMDTFMRM